MVKYCYLGQGWIMYVVMMALAEIKIENTVNIQTIVNYVISL